MDDSPDALSTAVVEAVAAAEGLEPTEVTQPLGEVLDSDALDKLFDPHLGHKPPTEGSVTFSYSGYDIRAHSDGRVELTEQVDRTISGYVASESVD